MSYEVPEEPTEQERGLVRQMREMGVSADGQALLYVYTTDNCVRMMRRLYEVKK